MNKMNNGMQQAIENATACATSCLESINYCSRKRGKYAEPSRLGLLLDCARICEITADYMLRKSPFYGILCELSAEICEQTARSCSEFPADGMLKDCTQKCMACTVSCREIAKMMKAA